MSDAARAFHETWLGMVATPKAGLVVSVAALLEADCHERLRADDHRAFLEMLEPAAIAARGLDPRAPRPTSIPPAADGTDPLEAPSGPSAEGPKSP